MNSLTDQAAQVLAEIDAELALADKATAGLDMDARRVMLDSWTSSNYAESAESSAFIVASVDAKNASQEKPVSGELVILRKQSSKGSERTQDEKYSTPDGRPEGADKSEGITLSTINKSGGSEWTGWLPDVSLRIRCANSLDAQKAHASIARNQSELDSIPKTQGVLIMSFLAPKEASIASKTWLFAAGSVTQLSATCESIAASRTVCPKSFRCLKTAIEGCLDKKSWDASIHQMYIRQDAEEILTTLINQWNSK